MIVLASSSPRRQELLKIITEDFIIAPANIDESIPDEIPALEAAEFLAVKKALAIHSPKSKKFNCEDIVIGCDTTVVIDGEIIGKPNGRDDAFRIIKLLQGRVHTVVTGVAVIEKDQTHSFSDISEVELYPLNDNEINAYLDTGEYADKAGGICIQGKGALLIKSIFGDYHSIMGLPAAKLARFLWLLADFPINPFL